MVVTNDERREVAARLRGNPENTLIPHRTGRHHGMGCHEAADRFWDMCDRIKSVGNYDIAYSTCSILADLIEPTDGFNLDHMAQVCFERLEGCDEPEYTLYEMILTAISRYKRGESGLPPAALVDRDALLALADEMEGHASDVSAGSNFVDSRDLMEYARRIREALGVQDA